MNGGLVPAEEKQLRLGDRRDLSERQLLIHVGLKEIFNDRDIRSPIATRCAPRRYVVWRDAFGKQNDAVGNFLGQDAAIAPYHRVIGILMLGKMSVGVLKMA